MKKSANVDISNLFRKFGGDTGSYQEIQQDYIGEKAQKNWPIVQAVEKERAVAPRLKMAHHVAPQPALHPATGHVPPHHAPAAGAHTAPRPLFGGLGDQAASPLFGAAEKSAPVSPLFGATEKPASPLFGGAEKPAPASSLFGAAEKPAAASSLFGAVASPATSAAKPASPLFGAAEKLAPAPAGAAERPAGSLFNTLGGARQPAAAASPVMGGGAVQGEPVQARRQEGDALNAVFSRLLNPQPVPAAAAPENNLRSMLGFLTK